MTTRILVAKYIRDPRRWEPVNVGVVVLQGDRAEARFIGERLGGTIDRRRARYVVGDTEVYQEWVRYWRRAIASGASGVTEILERKAPNYWVGDQGQVWFDGDGASLDELTGRYFAELVERGEDDDRDAAAPQLRQRVDGLLQQADLFKSDQFERDPVIETVDLDPPERYRFHYLARNGHATVGQRVSLDSVQVHDVLWKFQHLPDDYSRVAFVAGEEAPEDVAPALIHLSRAARLINVSSPSAVDEVREAFAL
jgi:hypothetical protein